MTHIARWQGYQSKKETQHFASKALLRWPMNELCLAEIGNHPCAKNHEYQAHYFRSQMSLKFCNLFPELGIHYLFTNSAVERVGNLISNIDFATLYQT